MSLRGPSSQWQSLRQCWTSFVTTLVQTLIEAIAKLQVLAAYKADRVNKGSFGRNDILSQCALHNVASINEVLNKGLYSEDSGPMLQQCRDLHACSCPLHHVGQCDVKRDKGRRALHASFQLHVDYGPCGCSAEQLKHRGGLLE